MDLMIPFILMINFMALICIHAIFVVVLKLIVYFLLDFCDYKCNPLLSTIIFGFQDLIIECFFRVPYL